MKAPIQSIVQALRFMRARSWLLTICLAAFLSSGGMGLMNPILSLYVRGFGVSTALVGFFITMFAVGRILVTLPAGRVADRWGRKGLMVLGAFITALSSLSMALAPSYPVLILTRLFQGVGSGLYTSAAFLVVADLATPAERGRINSIFQGSILLGLTVSPVVGGALARTFGIQAPLVGDALLALLVGCLILWRFPHSLGKANTLGAGNPEGNPVHSRSVTMGSLLTDPNFVLIALSAFLIFVARAGSRDTLMPLIGDAELGLDPAALGLVFSLISLFNLAAIPLAGFVADTLGRKYAVILGLLLNGAALVAIGISASYGWFILSALLMGAGKGFGEPSSIVYVTDISPSGRYGSSFGLFLTLRDLGLFVGPVLLSAIADLAGLRFPFILNGLAMLGVAVIFGVFARETLKVVNR